MPDWKPQEVSDVEIAFPAHALKLMPAWAEIPKEFKRFSSFREQRNWNALVSRWFFEGLRGADFYPREGIDADKALRHLKVIMGSFEPKHEHKEAAVAFLMSLWFKKATVGKDVYQ